VTGCVVWHLVAVPDPRKVQSVTHLSNGYHVRLQPLVRQDDGEWLASWAITQREIADLMPDTVPAHW
jgi:hypothetical protein